MKSEKQVVWTTSFATFSASATFFFSDSVQVAHLNPILPVAVGVADTVGVGLGAGAVAVGLGIGAGSLGFEDGRAVTVGFGAGTAAFFFPKA